jgi:hypothetical protein
VAKALTWGADEHILCALAAGWWLLARNKSPEQRLASDHVLSSEKQHVIFGMPKITGRHGPKFAPNLDIDPSPSDPNRL